MAKRESRAGTLGVRGGLWLPPGLGLTSPLGLPPQSDWLLPWPRQPCLPPSHPVVKLLPYLFPRWQMLGKSGQPRLPTLPGQLPTCPHPPWPKELDPLDSSSKCSSPLQSVPDTPVSSSARFLSPFDFLTTPISAGAEPWASLALGGDQAQGTVLGDRILWDLALATPFPGCVCLLFSPCSFFHSPPPPGNVPPPLPAFETNVPGAAQAGSKQAAARALPCPPWSLL